MALTTYTDTSGLWVNGSTPVNAANMNAMRAFLIAAGAMWDSNAAWDGSGRLNATTASTTINGGTSGTATLYQPLTGTFKTAVVVLNNFRTAGSNQDIALPVAFTTQAWISVTDLATMELVLAGTVKNMDVITGFGASTNNASISAYEQAGIKTGFDTVRFTSGWAAGHTGIVIIQGI
ncbi:MAG: hypothetical protein ACRDHW_00430 [Ktedonobacteraceae bacterium]